MYPSILIPIGLNSSLVKVTVLKSGILYLRYIVIFSFWSLKKARSFFLALDVAYKSNLLEWITL